MDPKSRSMIRITLPQEYEERAGVRDLVDRLMGTNPGAPLRLHPGKCGAAWTKRRSTPDERQLTGFAYACNQSRRPVIN